MKIPCLLIFYLNLKRLFSVQGAKDNLFYFADCLRQWVNSIDPEDNNRKRKRKFLFKRDPRDISQIWFYEPYSNTYFKVPTAKRDTTD